MQNPNQVKYHFIFKFFKNFFFSIIQILLNSMHRYIPRLHIIQASDDYSIRTGPLSTFIFDETIFIAVTAYQNDQVDLNPLETPLYLYFSRLKI